MLLLGRPIFVPPLRRSDHSKMCGLPRSRDILSHYNRGPTGNHFQANGTAQKSLNSGFYWPTLFQDAKRYVLNCNSCQRTGNIYKRNEMSLSNFIVEVFISWVIFKILLEFNTSWLLLSAFLGRLRLKPCL